MKFIFISGKKIFEEVINQFKESFEIEHKKRTLIDGLVDNDCNIVAVDNVVNKYDMMMIWM